MLRRVLCVLITAMLCFLVSCQTPPEQYDLTQTNVPIYKATDSCELTLEILYPTKRVSHKNPTVMVIHGGGWVSGSRDLFYKELEPLCTKLRENGVTVVGVDYRLAMNGLTWRDCLDDCEDALSYLIEHAEEYDIDTNNIGVIGYSAGAHLALMTTLETEDDVKLCVSLSGPTVMTFSGESAYYSEALEYYRDLAFGTATSEMMLSSPRALLSKRCKSDFLLVNGLHDDVIFPIHAESFCKEAASFGITAELMLVDGLTHSYQSFPQLGDLSAQITARMIEVMG